AHVIRRPGIVFAGAILLLLQRTSGRESERDVDEARPWACGGQRGDQARPPQGPLVFDRESDGGGGGHWPGLCRITAGPSVCGGWLSSRRFRRGQEEDRGIAARRLVHSPHRPRTRGRCRPKERPVGHHRFRTDPELRRDDYL